MCEEIMSAKIHITLKLNEWSGIFYVQLSAAKLLQAYTSIWNKVIFQIMKNIQAHTHTQTPQNTNELAQGLHASLKPKLLNARDLHIAEV